MMRGSEGNRFEGEGQMGGADVSVIGKIAGFANALDQCSGKTGNFSNRTKDGAKKCSNE